MSRPRPTGGAAAFCRLDFPPASGNSRAMRQLFRHLSLNLLVAALLLASLATGHARGQAPAAGEVVLCVGTQVVTVSVDENGQPVTVTRACPDGILKLAAPLTAPVVVPAPANPCWTWALPPTDLSAPSRRTVEDRARAPPLRA